MPNSSKRLRWTPWVAALVIASMILGLGASPASGEGTAVEVGSIALSKGETAAAEIDVKGISDPDGLGAYQLVLKFDPTVVQVEGVRGGESPFDSATSKVDNDAGQVRLNSFHGQVPGPTEDVVVAHLDVRAVGDAQQTTPLDLSFQGSGLVNTDGEPIPADIVDGVVTVNSTDSSGMDAPASEPSSDPASEPTATPTTAPTPTATPPPTMVPDTSSHADGGSGTTSTPTPSPTPGAAMSGGAGGGEADLPTATPPSPEEPETQAEPTSTPLPTPTPTEPSVTSGQDLPANPIASPEGTAADSVMQREDSPSTPQATPPPLPQAGTTGQGTSGGFPWWGWLLAGLVLVNIVVWGGLLFARPRRY